MTHPRATPVRLKGFGEYPLDVAGEISTATHTFGELRAIPGGFGVVCVPSVESTIGRPVVCNQAGELARAGQRMSNAVQTTLLKKTNLIVSPEKITAC